MSKLLEQINSELETKETVPLANLMSQITSKVNKIQKSDYLKFGLVPIYDQGDNDVSGYSNDVSNAYNGKLPVVIFGDHTLRLKRISSPFYLGADGNQLIEPMDENILDRNYFYYLLLSKKPRSYGYERHFKYLKEVEVKVPSLPTQKKIAEILSAYDAKIENNNFIIKKLEATAQTLFDEWFVNLRFPGHEKVKFVDSEMGEIPEGWEIKKVSDVSDLNKGVSYTSKEINTDNIGTALINLGNFKRGGGFNLKGTKYYTGDFKDSHLVKPGQILIAMTDLTSNREVIGHPARLPGNFKKAVISLDVCSLVPKKDIHNEFLYSLMLRRDFSKLMASCASGTNVSHLSKTHIEGYEFIMPTEKLLTTFNNFVQALFNKQALVENENQVLNSTKERLLAKLI